MVGIVDGHSDSLTCFHKSEASRNNQCLAPMFTYNIGSGDEQNTQTPKDTRTVEAKRFDELALQYRMSRDPEILNEMRALARRLASTSQ
jgi:hypothetical protein